MDVRVFYNLESDAEYYGHEQVVEDVLNEYYPEYDVEISPEEGVFTTDDGSISVSLKITGINLNGTTITPDCILINSVELSGRTFTDTISASREYVIEVIYNGYTTIKRKVIIITSPTYVGFFSSNPDISDIDTSVDTSDLTESKQYVSCLKVFDKEYHDITIYNENDGANLWVITPYEYVEGTVLGLLEAFSMNLYTYEDGYYYWKSTETFNEGSWRLVIGLDGEYSFEESSFVDADSCTVITADNYTLNCR